MARTKSNGVTSSLERIRPVIPAIERTAHLLRPFEKCLATKIEELEAIVDDSRITTFNIPLGEDSLFDLLVVQEGHAEEESQNGFGLYHHISKTILETYRKLYNGHDNEGHSVVPLWQRLTLTGPNPLSGLYFSNQIKAVRATEALSVKDQCDFAAKEMDLTYAVANDYASSIRLLFDLSGELETLGDALDDTAVGFVDSMVESHLTEGERIIESPPLTAMAYFLWNHLPGIANLDHRADPAKMSKLPKERSAQLLTYLTAPDIFPFVENGNKTISYATQELGQLHAFFAAVFPIARSFQKEYARCTQEDAGSPTTLFDVSPHQQKIREIDFNNIHHQPVKGISSQIELEEEARNDAAFTNIIADLRSLAAVKGDSARIKKARAVVSRIYERRAESVRAEEHGKRYYRTVNKGEDGHENKIDIELVDPPYGDITRVRGKNFDKFREWLDDLVHVAKYSALATVLDPRRRIRENFFMIGPPGTGKTEALRGVYLYYNWNVVSLSGPDLGNMWKDETQKNPGRLADRLTKLYYETGKRVIVCVDEVEGIWKKDRGRDSKTSEQLTAAFNEIFEGVRHVEGIHWIAAANSIEHFPESLMRRFSPNIYVVGELTTEDRSALLKDFVERCLPLDKSITSDLYSKLARRMSDATGDIVRTPVEVVSKYFLREMVKHHPTDVSNLNNYLHDGKGNFNVKDLTPEKVGYVKEVFAGYGYCLTDTLLSRAVQSTMATAEIRDRIRKAREDYREANRKVKEMGVLQL